MRSLGPPSVNPCSIALLASNKEIIQDVNGLEIAVVTKDVKMREDGAL